MGNRVELLAPAGNYDAFLGAVNAGADAVYLGGEKFGARAYADNFSAEEICRAIHVAHFMGRKIYLTVNTLVKEAEFAKLYDDLLPLYEAGLDGVIVQDMGVLRYIREHFEGLSLHASTQMTLTGWRGAAFAKEQGVARIVPARELSLEEVRRIKDRTGLEIECFIHGAMCYCYSGQCLFSSILGGRSGNRGRCAQPCRLPYRIYEGKERADGAEYPLSLKDMCTILYIPQLIGAGIDSFKIEGRMKKPEYAAGVTAVYRKYIDLYEKEGADGYRVAKEDMRTLQSLYIRSEIQTGYYERHNGREMITLHKPGYAGNDRQLLERIHEAYVREPDRRPVRMSVELKAGQPARLRISGQNAVGEPVTATVCGGVAKTAQRAPLREENVRKQLLKTGNYCVAASDCEITMDDNVFMPVSALNELRRQGLETYERQCIISQGLISRREKPEESRCGTELVHSEEQQYNKVKTTTLSATAYKQPAEDVVLPVNPCEQPMEATDLSVTACERSAKASDLLVVPCNQPTELEATDISVAPCDQSTELEATDISVTACDQLAEAVHHPCRRIYVDSDLYLAQNRQVRACMDGHPHIQFYLALPYVLRAQDEGYLLCLSEAVGSHAAVRGFLARNLEGFAYVRSLGSSYEAVPDAGLYSFNGESMRFWAKYCREYTLPYELNRREAGRLTGCADGIGMRTALIVYGRIPLMVTANCIRKTAGRCEKDGFKGHDRMWLKDRCQTAFPVWTNCGHCYNIIYNSLPYSLHLQEREIRRIGAGVRRYDFTLESAEECRRVLTGGDFPCGAYTTGHLKRGVE